jgi:hypothetical protein
MDGTKPTTARVRLGYFILLAVVSLPFAGALLAASYLHLSSPTRAMGAAFMDAVPGRWHKQFGVSVGYFTLAAARFGTSFFRIPEEPKAVLSAVNGAEVGVYRLEDSTGPADFRQLMASSDKTMRWRGRERIVVVTEGDQCVVVYAPKNLSSLRAVSCCVGVLNGRDLVVVSARGNVNSLLDIAREHLPNHGHFLGEIPGPKL